MAAEQRAARMADRYRRVRRQTERLCEPLAVEDQVVQSMPDVSPTRWHLAHTTWFFETFVLRRAGAAGKASHPAWQHLFNSYYNSVGEQFPRARRGLVTRPTVEQIYEYRRQVDQCIEELLERDGHQCSHLLPVVELGLHHEQQHQELILTDIKHVLSCNPLKPAYRPGSSNRSGGAPAPAEWVEGPTGLQWVGHQGELFAFDNERPRHQALLHPHSLASRLVTAGEYLEFIEDDGYRRPELWLSLGWLTVGEQCWHAPLYWQGGADGWYEFTLEGLQPLDRGRPVSHVSYFEADAFARWAGARLPTEQEWEVTARSLPVEGNFVEQLRLRPQSAGSAAAKPTQLYGDLWEWTSSPYTPYPGYDPPPGALGEYNGKFMCNQYVLRGGSFATPSDHIRPTYRNFFPPDARWQFTGIRLAR